jgi:hypothetical protein
MTKIALRSAWVMLAGFPLSIALAFTATLEGGNNNMVMSAAGQRLLYDIYFTDHHELPGSQSAALLTDLKSKGADLLRIDVKFVSEHPEMEKLRLELLKILREKGGA